MVPLRRHIRLAVAAALLSGLGSLPAQADRHDWTPRHGHGDKSRDHHGRYDHGGRHGRSRPPSYDPGYPYPAPPRHEPPGGYDPRYPYPEPPRHEPPGGYDRRYPYPAPPTGYDPGYPSPEPPQQEPPGFVPATPYSAPQRSR